VTGTTTLARRPRGLQALALAAAAGLSLALPLPTAAQRPAPLYAWVQAASGGVWQVRMVMPGSAHCPRRTRERAAPDSAFPVRVCSRDFPAGVTRLAVAGRSWQAPDSVSSVAVIGDTGCRATQQDCGDPLDWPFARAAQAAANARADLNLHVGDFVYRERCSPGVLPCGDGWATWEADFFAPAGPLLTSAPWVLVRGNHEDCSRGGRGWYRFFDPDPLPAEGCRAFSDPFAVQVRGMGRLLVLDTSCATWYSTACWSLTLPSGEPVNDSARAIPAYAAQFEKLGAIAGSDPAWLLTHVPIWAVDTRGTTANPNPDSSGSYVLQNALRRAPDAGAALQRVLRLSLFGHIHIWELIGFAGARAPVLVAGNGGTARNDPIPAPAQPLDGVTAASFSESRAFGFTLLERTTSGWRATLHALDASCSIEASAAACVSLREEEEEDEAAEEAEARAAAQAAASGQTQRQ
jgi:hypothetical protein